MRIINADVLDGLRSLDDSSVHCCVTSPPYWGLRDYGHAGQIGLEPTPEAYVARMVEVFREVRRVLREDGTCWVNLGDSYASGEIGRHDRKEGRQTDGGHSAGKWRGQSRQQMKLQAGIKPKDLVGIPWRVAFALQADGWWLRQDIIWHKPNPMPESVRDRCTKAHEYVFLMTKSARYFYDADAIHEKSVNKESIEGRRPRKSHALAEIDPKGFGATRVGFLNGRSNQAGTTYPTRNRRSVWTITTKPYSGAHFAVMPPDLVEPCIKAGCPEGGTVLDPFAGSGTTLAVAMSLGRDAVGIEINPEYVQLIHKRIEKQEDNLPLFGRRGA